MSNIENYKINEPNGVLSYDNDSIHINLSKITPDKKSNMIIETIFLKMESYNDLDSSLIIKQIETYFNSNRIDNRDINIDELKLVLNSPELVVGYKNMIKGKTIYVPLNSLFKFPIYKFMNDDIIIKIKLNEYESFTLKDTTIELYIDYTNTKVDTNTYPENNEYIIETIDKDFHFHKDLNSKDELIINPKQYSIYDIICINKNLDKCVIDVESKINGTVSPLKGLSNELYQMRMTNLPISEGICVYFPGNNIQKKEIKFNVNDYYHFIHNYSVNDTDFTNMNNDDNNNKSIYQATYYISGSKLLVPT